MKSTGNYSKITKKEIEDALNDLVMPKQERFSFFYYCYGKKRIVDGGDPKEGTCSNKRCSMCVDLKTALRIHASEYLKEAYKVATMSLLDSMKEQMALIEENAVAFSEKGNKAAGTRARKAALELKGLCHDLRVAIQKKKNEG